MNSEITIAEQKSKPQISNKKNVKRLKILGVIFTIFGVALFSHFIYSVGFNEILSGITKIGFGGFAFILLLYFLKLVVRAIAWRLSVYEPYKLNFKDTLPAVIIGEALSSIIPLGILISGTAKAVAVRRRVPLVVGLASIATENLFYSLVTGLFICFGAFAFLRQFPLEPTFIYLIDLVIGSIIISIIVGTLMVVRQWHWASDLCNWFYDRGILRSILEKGRGQIRQFEDLIYGFYHKYPKRFFPIFLLQILFHSLGIFEVWFILTRISDLFPQFSTAFFLESMSRLITIVFKLIPFLVGVDEAGAEFIVETLAVGTGIGVTLAIIRKGRTIFWAAIGLLLIIKRGFSFKEIQEIGNGEK
ncbi:MAG: lysylphosphatidylglycerol synthase transmembrane domain-containing protein [Aridibacter sp.]